MVNGYLEELIQKIELTEVWSGVSEKCGNYDAGMRMLIDVFTEHKLKQAHLFFIGNGGSSAIASHMTADFMKNGGMNTYSLYDNAVTTCMGNDYGYEYIFSHPLRFLGDEGDLLVAISSSGNSKNIVNAIQVAQEKKLRIVTLSGFQKNNRIINRGIYNIYVPSSHYGMVESIHNLILQQIVDAIKQRDGECL